MNSNVVEGKDERRELINIQKKPAGITVMHKSLILHFRPRMVQVRALDFKLTFGLGGMAFILIIMLFVTGVLLKFFYLPFPDRAYESIVYLENKTLFGKFIRNIHFWSANILVIIAFLHFLRVFFTSAFHPPRRFNWVIGLGLLIIILLFNFTGYLLPWDQLSYWAVAICTSMMDYIPVAGEWMRIAIRGHAEVGSYTLSVFYAAHTALLSAVMIILLPFHFWHVRKAGGVVIPSCLNANDNTVNAQVPAVPNLILRELATALIMIAVILFISILFDAPLGDKANPGLSPNPAKAPWYFMGFQEILLHLHPLLAILIIPLLIIAGLLKTAFTRYSAGREGVWFVSLKGRSIAVVSSAAALIVTCVAIIADEYLPDLTGLFPGLSPLICNGLIPLFIASIGYYAIHLLLVKHFFPDRNEKVQMVFVFFLTVFIVLTVTGIWFRGPGMKLVWPFAG